jgi:hypothetical protein
MTLSKAVQQQIKDKYYAEIDKHYNNNYKQAGDFLKKAMSSKINKAISSLKSVESVSAGFDKINVQLQDELSKVFKKHPELINGIAPGQAASSQDVGVEESKSYEPSGGNNSESNQNTSKKSKPVIIPSKNTGMPLKFNKPGGEGGAGAKPKRVASKKNASTTKKVVKKVRIRPSTTNDPLKSAAGKMLRMSSSLTAAEKKKVGQQMRACGTISSNLPLNFK